jgi:hypothetical protein
MDSTLTPDCYGGPRYSKGPYIKGIAGYFNGQTKAILLRQVLAVIEVPLPRARGREAFLKIEKMDIAAIIDG